MKLVGALWYNRFMLQMYSSDFREGFMQLVHSRAIVQ